MTVPPHSRAIASASADLPLAVGPPRMTAGRTETGDLPVAPTRFGPTSGDPQRDPLEVAAAEDQEGDDAVAAVLGLLDARIDVARRDHRLLVDLDDDVALMQALLGGRAVVLH